MHILIQKKGNMPADDTPKEDPTSIQEQSVPMDTESTQEPTMQTAVNATPRVQGKDNLKKQEPDKADEIDKPKQMLTITTSSPRLCEEEVPPLKVTYYNWQRIHETWLNDVMKEKLGVKEGLG